MSKSDAWYATVEHYRAWLFADGGFTRSFAKEGKFTPTLIRQMARHYSVTRTIPSVDPDGPDGESDRDRNRQIVADELNRLAQAWPAALNDKAAAVIDTARRIRDGIGRGKAPYSAVSKFIWFAADKDWTLFDSLASAGMLPAGGNSEQRVVAFYDALSGPLPSLVSRLRPVCENSGLNLRPERIIDIFLMLRGARSVRESFADDLIAGAETFQSLLPGDLGRQLGKVADEVAEILFSDELPRPSTVAWRARKVKY